MPKKKILAIFVIIASIFVSIFINRSFLNNEITLGVEEKNTNEGVFSEGVPGQNQYNLNINATESLTSDLLNQLQASGVIKFNIGNADLFTNNPFEKFPEVDEKKLKISEDVFGKSQTEYFKELIQTGQKYIKEYGLDSSVVEAINNIIKKRDTTKIKIFAEGYKKLSESYYEIIVPRSWIDIHKAYISYFQTYAMAYESIANYETDPLKAYFATITLDRLKERGDEIILLIDKKAEETGLNFNDLLSELYD